MFMKKILGLVLPIIILAFSIAFMTCIFEPITMYGNNVNDFWFDLSILLKPSLLSFIVVFLVIIVLFLLLFGITSKIKIKSFSFEKIYYLLFIVTNAFFISSYIEGNFLAGFLPSLDGSSIIWNDYKSAIIISNIIWFVILAAMLILFFKKDAKKIISILKYVNLSICVMLIVSLVSTFATTDVLQNKDYKLFITTNNINKYSSSKNFIIFLVDAVDSKDFVLANSKNKNYNKTFKNFTYFPDTLSAYRFTRDSIPLILSGIANYNEKAFPEYYVHALDNSYLFKELEKRDYEMNIFETDFIYNSKNAEKVKNVVFDDTYDTFKFIKQEAKYVLFKYLPFEFKRFSKIETMNFNSARLNIDNLYEWNNTIFYNTYSNEEPEIVKENQFKFIHIEGGHVPFDIDENVNVIDNGTYYDKLRGTTTIIDKYINYLKNNNIYDNSVIILMADHGYGFRNSNRLNPIFYVKGFDEKHKYEVLDKPVSYFNLDGMYSDLLNNKKSNELFKDASGNEERKFLYYDYLKEDHMAEYVQKDKAWNDKTMEPTGKEYNR